VSDLSALSKESVKSLGAGAYLVNVLPSAVLILTAVAMYDSRLFPWSQPRINDDDQPIPRGLASVLDAFSDRGIGGAIVIALAILVVAVLLRPFQIRTVQLLEGYWKRGGLLKALFVERHTRRASAIMARADIGTESPERTDFAAVARYARQAHRATQIESRAEQEVWRYPIRADWVLPTALGNVLRRAETTAGERYGLDTVNTYPRLYPHLSARLDAEINEQLNSIDAMAIFVVVFTMQTLLTTPLVWWLDGWSVLPVILAALVATCYRGAIAAAGRYGVLLAAAFDLHRFDMLAAMHLPTHADGDQEYAANVRLADLLTADRPWPPDKRRTWTYAHPPPLDQIVAGLAQRPGGGKASYPDAESGNGGEQPPEQVTEDSGAGQGGDRADPGLPAG
jgi:hypothetical protein